MHRLKSSVGEGAPLCEHHIAEVQKRTERYARAFVTTLARDHPQSKAHLLCAHMADQAQRMGGPGMLGESAIEGEHVRDNMLKRRYATTVDPLSESSIARK